MKSFMKTICAASLCLSMTLPTMAQPTTAAPTPPEIAANKVLSIYSDAFSPVTTWNFGDWESGTQYAAETIGTDNVVKFVTTDAGYFGWEFTSDVNAVTMTKLHIDVWSEQAFTFNLTPICRTQPTGEQPQQISVNAGEWTQIDLDMEVYSDKGLDLSGIYQLKFSDAGAQTFYVDNVYFYNSSTETDTEAPTGLTASLVSTSFFSVTLNCMATDNSGGVNFIITDESKGISITKGAPSGTATNITVDGLAPATEYNFTIVATDADENKCETPATVQATTLALPGAAPTPTADADNVISIYSDAYTPATTFAIGGWGQTTIATEKQLDGDNAYLLDSFNYLGLELNSKVAAFDATGMTYLHIDVYTPNATAFSITPIWGGEALYTCTPLEQGTWNSFDIPLAEAYPGMNYTNIYQIKITAEPASQATVFIDNIYFHNGSAAADKEAPSLTKAELANVTYSSATLTVAATDNSGKATIEIYDDEACENLIKSQEITADGNDQTIVIDQLEAETKYTFYVKAKDAAGNYADATLTVSATTIAAPEEMTYTGTVDGPYAGNGAATYAPEINYSITYTPTGSQLTALVTLPEVPELEGFTPQIRIGATEGFNPLQREGETTTYSFTATINAAAGETIDITVLFAWTGNASEVTFQYVVGSINQTVDEEAPVLTKAELAEVTKDSATLTVAATDNSGKTTIEIYDDEACENLIKSQEITADGNDQTIVIDQLEAGAEYTFYVKAKDAADNYAEDTLTVDVTTESSTSGVASLEDAETVIYTTDGTLHINGACGMQVRIYSVSGQLVYTTTAAESTTITLAKGMYVVMAGDTIKKVML